jgi:hypothetical protein
MTDLPRDIEHELAALADGSLARERREQAHARVSESRELRSVLAEQRRAVELLGAVDARAPASLHRQVEAMLVPARRWRQRANARRANARGGFAGVRVGFAAAAAAALAAAAVAIGLSGGASPGLNVQQAAALTLSPATMEAPAEDEAHRAQLEASVDGVTFPYWRERFGWRGSGARSDRVAGREVRTVFYSNAQGKRIGYAIASGQAPMTRGGTVVERWGVQYRVLNHDGATVVTWQRAGHLCVVGGRGVSERTLLGLASWGSERRHSA